MNKLLLSALITLLFVHLGEGQGLRCMECKFTMGAIPCFQSTKTCDPGQVCGTIKGQSGKVNFITRRDCVDRNRCNVNDTTTFGALTYTTSTTCCEEELCNSGVGALRFSLLAGFAALLCIGLAWIV